MRLAEAVDQQTFTDPSGDAPWDVFTNTYSDGTLAAQLVANADGTITTTEWDMSGVATWDARQTVMAADQSVITTTTLNKDGSADIFFGRGADGRIVLAANDGQLDLVDANLAREGQTAFQPTEGDILRPLTNNAARITTAGGAAGAGALIVGMTGLPASAGADTYQQLSDDVRIAFHEDARPPTVETRVDKSPLDLITGPTWKPLPDIPVTAGPANTLLIDGDKLKAAIGDQKFAALGSLEGRGVSLAMQPSPVAPADIPKDSIFADGSPPGTLYAPQGSVVDWRAPHAWPGAAKYPSLSSSRRPCAAYLGPAPMKNR